MGAEAGEAPSAVPSSGQQRISDVKSKVEGLLPGTAASDAKREWNTKKLGPRVAADAAAAASAGVLVAPLITIIDKAIIENASGKQALLPSLRASAKTLLLRPHHFLVSRPFLLIFTLYTGTYLTANTIDTVSSTLSRTPASSTTSGLAKFSATSSANLSLCLYKDSQFARLFGTAASASRAVPGPTYALFAARDCLTIFASFNLPPLIAPRLPLSDALEQSVSRATAAQFLAPAAVQIFSTPLHLLGLDLFNRAGPGVAWTSRAAKVRKDWFMSAVARMARIVPAFGVGGVVNTRVRKGLMEELE